MMSASARQARSAAWMAASPHGGERRFVLDSWQRKERYCSGLFLRLLGALVLWRVIGGVPLPLFCRIGTRRRVSVTASSAHSTRRRIGAPALLQPAAGAASR